MKSRLHESAEFQPRMVAARKPLRPTQVAAARRPVKVTKPFVLVGETIPPRRAR